MEDAALLPGSPWPATGNAKKSKATAERLM
jgi:hypothetical protein